MKAAEIFAAAGHIFSFSVEVANRIRLQHWKNLFRFCENAPAVFRTAPLGNRSLFHALLSRVVGIQTP